MQGLVLAKFPDLSLGLTYGGSIGQRLSDSLSLDLIGKTEAESVTWNFGLMAAAIWACRIGRQARGPVVR